MESTFARRLLPLPLVAALLLAGPAEARHSHPTPGAAGIGDRLFPELGNGGYDALHYDLDVTYPTSEPAQTVNGHVTMLARATKSLSRFDLDFSGDSVASVRVNGASADFSRVRDELVITPDRALGDNSRFVVRVTFTSHSYTPDPSDPFPFGWFATRDGSVTAGQPNLSHSIYPVNDHPADKASYTVRMDVPEGTTAISNGVKLWSRTRGGRTVSTFLQRQPMASELLQLAVGALDVIQRGRQHGVQLRDAVASSHAAADEPALARTPDHLAWMESKVGRYPFDSYGVLAADQQFFYALETQTLSLHPTFLFEPPRTPAGYEPVMVHELAHQWFGDSVAPETWSDVWLNEGHASWYENEYAAEFFGEDFEAFMRAAYANGDQLRHDFGPVALPTHNDLFGLFSDNVYTGGALVLYALRQVVGDRTFREIEREWVQRNAGESRGTEDFIALASKVSHRHLTGFLRDWLYGETTPAMPGHPDWTVDPVEEATAASARGSAARRLELGFRR
jgi:aminopeptidase N